MSLTAAVKAEASRLGFHLAGVTTPDSPPHFAIYERWVRQNRHAGMSYLATERSLQRRADPRQVLPQCKSILVLGARYAASEAALYGLDQTVSTDNRLTGQVASYAWGDDYHTILSERLRSLVSFIEVQVGSPLPNRWYSDTGPILERDLAQRAGLGWIGKNTCLIHPRLGSYFFLAEVLLGIDLDVDEPFTADRCGACRRCLEACPTGCILPDRTLDASRCISYLTIELKGSIPASLRSSVGSWVFGCDICQQVCPWNQRFATRECDPAFLPRRDILAPHLLDALSLDAPGFNRRFKDSPILRPRRRGYLRNVCVAIGNSAAGSADPEAVGALEHVLLNEAEGLVRCQAAWALGKVGGGQAHRILERAAANERDEAVLMEIRESLSSIMSL